MNSKLNLMNDEVKIDEVEVKSKAETFNSFPNNINVKRLEGTIASHYSKSALCFRTHNYYCRLELAPFK